MRGLASVAKPWLPAARVYEPATFGVFTQRLQESASSYVISEYLPGGGTAGQRGGPRHEDIEALTFADGTFDLVLTSEVFEHVANPWIGFSEIRRVLRRDGRHIFTVPVVPGRPTATRSPNQPVFHIDPLRTEGALVITDFGGDLANLLSPLGFETTVHLLPPESPVLRVYESVAR
jgi:SAM-dependent methyltransferase